MKTSAFQPKTNNDSLDSTNISQEVISTESGFFTPSRVGFLISFVAHAAFALSFLDIFSNLDLRQDGDNITTIALATFQTPSNDDVETPKPKPIERKKHHHHREIIKEHGKLAKKEEEYIPPAKAPNAKPDEKMDEGEVIQTLSYRTGQEDELFSKIKRAIDKRNKYPHMARKRGMEGEVIVEFIIYKDGRVANIRIVKACPHEPLNTAVVTAIKKARADFPQLKVTTKIEIPIVYELKMADKI